MRDIAQLEKTIKVRFTDKQLLLTALTHRSYLNENREQAEHNERLEFLGDAVLELATTEYLFHTLPDKPEGELTSLRAALVRKENLDKVAQSLQLGEYLRLSKGEDAGGGRTNAYILANTVEALIGAIYLDHTYKTAKKFIETFVLPELPRIIENSLHRDAKSYLQELAQERVKVTPSYDIISESGPDHDKTFIAGVFFAGEEQGRGEGRSKQSAELKAAEDALKKLKW
ncbi:MAG TPA: ribonuclease III [bacterium]|nr:ribonuclease III [bacterium]